MKVCLAGPMSGLPDFNYPAFNAVAAWLREQSYEVFNPAESFAGDTTLARAQYLRASLREATFCDRLLLLDGWENSRGAILELLVAYETGAEIWEGGQTRKIQGEPQIFRWGLANDVRLALDLAHANGALPDFMSHWILGIGVGTLPITTAFAERDHFGEEIDEIRALQAAKRSDYTAGHTDPLANYRFSAGMVGLDVVHGMVMRLSEKLYRVKSVLEKDGATAVADESLADTFRDLAIISILCKLASTPGTPHHDYGAAA